MAKGKGLFEASAEKKAVKEVNRGTQDEFEIIIQIIEKNLSIKFAVLEKIRQTKYRLGINKKEQPSSSDDVKKAK